MILTVGEIETALLGYLGSQDTFYVGSADLPGTFVGTYSKWAASKLDTTKTPITAADLLTTNAYCRSSQKKGMGMIRILTDRGTEYCSKPETLDYRSIWP